MSIAPINRLLDSRVAVTQRDVCAGNEHVLRDSRVSQLDLASNLRETQEQFAKYMEQSKKTTLSMQAEIDVWKGNYKRECSASKLQLDQSSERIQRLESVVKRHVEELSKMGAVHNKEKVALSDKFKTSLKEKELEVNRLRKMVDDQARTIKTQKRQYADLETSIAEEEDEDCGGCDFLAEQFIEAKQDAVKIIRLISGHPLLASALNQADKSKNYRIQGKALSGFNQDRLDLISKALGWFRDFKDD